LIVVAILYTYIHAASLFLFIKNISIKICVKISTVKRYECIKLQYSIEAKKFKL